MKSPIGLDTVQSQALAAELNKLLASYQILYMNVRGFHWNIRGNQFFELHLKFEEIYNDLLLKVDALAERAAALRKIEVVRPRGALGKNTVAALQAGIVIGFAGQIDALVDRLRTDVAELADAAVVLTGLRADVVADESRTITDVEPELALEGLRLVFERNC